MTPENAHPDNGQAEEPESPLAAAPYAFTARGWWTCFAAIVLRECLRFWHQRSRFLGALVRPLIWLLVFAAGFRAALGLSIMPPYETYITYETWIVPGLIAMIQLFNGMQSSLSMVYDRETGSMRLLLSSPFPRWYLLLCKLLAGVLVSLLQIYAFLIVAALAGIDLPLSGHLYILPGLMVNGLMLGGLGMVLSSTIRQLENFAGVMNFVVFPLFFLSSALYPLWKMRESSEILYHLCRFNPFTHGVEVIRFSLYGQLAPVSWAVLTGCALVFLLIAFIAYQPGGRLIRKRQK